MAEPEFSLGGVKIYRSKTMKKPREGSQYIVSIHKFEGYDEKVAYLPV